MEPIKQEIVNNIYENGENLITGPVLQEVLLDMVDDTNAKISSSVGDVVTLITEVSESALKPEDLEGYATEQWVEEQGYLKEVPEGYATTESLNQLSESVSASISSIPSVDLSGYATTQSVNEATESVKEWVEAKHYLTTASLSGSVTEESVQFMINDSTASMKEWVESQSYATETFVSESIASLDIPDTSGFVTTQSYNLDSASFDERINAITGSDLSGYATTESLNQLSESVASDSASFDERINSIVVPDVSGYATTESLNQVSESVASDITSLSESIAAITGSDLSGYVTTASYNQDSASFDQRIDAIVVPDLSEYATTASVNELSESLSQSIAAITGSDLSGYATTQSVNQLSESVAIDSASFDQRISAITGSDLSGYATTESLNQLSESVAQDLEGKADKSDLPDLSTYATTESLNQLSESLSESIPDVSIYATTESLNTVSQSLSASIAAITGSDLSGYVTTASYNQDSASFNQRIENIIISGSGEDTDLRNFLFGLNTDPNVLTNLDGEKAHIYQAVVNDYTLNWIEEPEQGKTYFIRLKNNNDSSAGQEVHITIPDTVGNSLTSVVDGQEGSGSLSIPRGKYAVISYTRILDKVFFTTSEEEVPIDLSGYATTASVNALSASFDQRIDNITGSGQDTVLREYLFGTGSLLTDGTIYPSASSNWVWEVSESRTFPLGAEVGEGKSIQVIVHNVGANEVEISFNDEYWGPYSVVNGALGSGSFTVKAGEYGDVVATQINDKIYFRTSVDLSNIEVDLSGYATTESLNQVSESLSASIAATTASVNQISASFDQRINNIVTGSGGDLSALADPSDPDNPVFLALASASFAEWDMDYHGGEWRINVPLQGMLEGEASSFWDLTDVISPLERYFLEAGIWRVDFQYDEEHDLTSWSIDTNNAFNESTWQDNPVYKALESLGLAQWIEDGGGYWSIKEPEYFTLTSASFDQRINAITASVNQISASLNGVSSSFVEFSASYNPSPWEKGTGTGSAQIHYNHAVADFSIAEGYNSVASGNYSHAEGYNSQAVGRSSHAEGENTLAGLEGTPGRGAHAEGVNTRASGHGSHAEGYATRTWQDYTHAEGYSSNANRACSHAEGYMTLAQGNSSHAEGSGSEGGDPNFYITPLGSDSFTVIPVEGEELPNFYAGYTFISNYDIFEIRSIGENNTIYTGTTHSITTQSLARCFNGPAALGKASHVEGYGTKATNEYEHAQGKFNATASSQIFSVGVGHDKDSRRNAISVITGSNDSASVYIQGVGGYDGTNPQPGTNDVVTVIANLVARIEALESGSNA